MKQYRLQHNIETRIAHTFIATGIGIDYMNYPTRGRYNQDIAQLELTEQIWFDIPLAMVDRRSNLMPAPFGFKFTHPIILWRGAKARFWTNQNVQRDDIHLVFYGHYVPDENAIQKKPLAMIYLRAWEFPARTTGWTSMRLEVPHIYNLLSYGFLWAEKVQGMAFEEYMALPETVRGFMEIIGKKYLFDEDRNRSLAMTSDLFLAYRARVNDFNVKLFRVEGNETLKIALEDVLDVYQNLFTLIEYEKIAGIPMRELVIPYVNTEPQEKIVRVKPGQSRVISALRPKPIPPPNTPTPRTRDQQESDQDFVY